MVGVISIKSRGFRNMTEPLVHDLCRSRDPTTIFFLADVLPGLECDQVSVIKDSLANV